MAYTFEGDFIKVKRFANGTSQGYKVTLRSHTVSFYVDKVYTGRSFRCQMCGQRSSRRIFLKFGDLVGSAGPIQRYVCTECFDLYVFVCLMARVEDGKRND